jgi:hypothetical protein
MKPHNQSLPIAILILFLAGVAIVALAESRDILSPAVIGGQQAAAGQ